MVEFFNQKVNINQSLENLNLGELGQLVYDKIRAHSSLEISHSEFLLKSQKIAKELHIIGGKLKSKELKTENSGLANCALDMWQIGTNPVNIFLKTVVSDLFGSTGEKIFDMFDMVNLFENPDPKEAISAMFDFTKDTKDKKEPTTQELRQKLEMLLKG